MSGASETAGLFFPKAINFIFCAMYLQMIVQIVMFFVSQDSQGNVSATPEGAFEVVLLIITIAAHYFIYNSFGSLFTALPLSLVPPADSSNNTGAYSSPSTGEKKPLLGDGQNVHQTKAGMVSSDNAASATAASQNDGEEDPLLAFTPAPLKEQQREIWIAEDPIGLGRAEHERNRQANVRSTLREATRDDQGKLHTTAHCPPGEFLP